MRTRSLATVPECLCYPAERLIKTCLQKFDHLPNENFSPKLHCISLAAEGCNEILVLQNLIVILDTLGMEKGRGKTPSW